MDEEHQRQKIRAKAYELWAAEGRPEGRLLAVENTGEFPTLTDQGEEAANPRAPQPANKKSRSRSRT
jgi:hypothetical protein